MRAAVSLLVLGAATVALAGCKEKEVAAPPVRPVLSVLAEPHNGRSLGFAGTVEPQYKVGFGFRVLGRIVARDVNVGDMVKRDQQLAAIDSVALELATRTAQADVANAQARLVNASGVLGRQQILLQQNTATQAEFDSAQQAQQTADNYERSQRGKPVDAGLFRIVIGAFAPGLCRAADRPNDVVVAIPHALWSALACGW